MLIDAANLFARKETVSKETFDSAVQDMSSEEKDSLLWALLQHRNSDIEKLQAMRKEMFGTSSEKGQTLFEHLFNETETVEEIEELLEQDEDQAADTKQKKPRKRMSGVTSSLPVVKEDKYPEDPEFLAHKDEMIQLTSDVQRTVEFVPARYYVKETTYHNFVWKISEDEQKFFSPQKPARLLERSMVSASVAAHLIHEKAINGMPINRQTLDLQKKGFDIDRQTVNNWALRTSQDYLVPLADHMLKDFRKLHTVHMDETGLKVLEIFRNGGNSVSTMVVGASGPFEKRQMRIYRFFSGKGQTFVQEVLSDGFTGNLVTDGAACYENWTNAHNGLHPDMAVVHAGCMTHARRKFVEAAEVRTDYQEYRKLGKKKQAAYLAEHPGLKSLVDVIELIAGLYRIEKKCGKGKLDPQEIREAREKEAVPLFCQLTKHVEKMREEYPPSGKAGQAVKYFLSRKESLSTYLKDGEIPIDNNKAERTVKPFVIARKGFLFSDSKRGAEATAASFSVLQSAVDNGLNPEKYLKWVLEKLSSEGLKDSVMDEAVPYSENLPADLYVKKKK
ncbi:IS66 family transposase [Faecalibaculum rodentium]|jgi:transposase|uniref:IS66 family transposase n=2 Tax=Faecalibaculum rodentium TaxID=1702221 RepID=UPI00256FC74C|nr:IS66 family transposase [Faecalibaculum rodentium]